MVRIDEDNANFQIQCRTERATRSDGKMSEATIFSAFAVNTTEVWLQVELNTNKSGVNVYAGTTRESWADYTTDLNNNVNFTLQAVDGLEVSRQGNTTVAFLADSG